MAAFPVEILPGTLIESSTSHTKYAAEHLLGAGAVGHVWLCREVATQEPRVVKVLPMPSSKDWFLELQRMRAALEEARASRTARFYEADTIVNSNVTLIASEALEGVPASHLTATMVRTPPYHMVCAILSDVVAGLKELHDLHLAHGNLKGENVIVTVTGQSRLVDFGLTGHAAYRLPLASCDYMAPELLFNNQNNQTAPSARTDIWAVGMLATELVHRRPPFAGLQPNEKLARIANGRLQALAVPGYGMNFVGLVSNCLRFDPLRRPSANELLITSPFSQFNPQARAEVRNLVLGFRPAITPGAFDVTPPAAVPQDAPAVVAEDVSAVQRHQEPARFLVEWMSALIRPFLNLLRRLWQWRSSA